jgi:hypothetical protein
LQEKIPITKFQITTKYKLPRTKIQPYRRKPVSILVEHFSDFYGGKLKIPPNLPLTKGGIENI